MRRVPLLAILAITIPITASAGDVKNGEILFKKHCKGCHRLTEGVVMGPSLKGVTARVSEEWLDKWIENPKAVLESGDPYAKELVAKFKKVMPSKKAMSDSKNRADVISFLKTVE